MACPNTRVIALYIESIRRGRAFIELARSIGPLKPIVAFYAGGSEAGQRASFSHTGAMAGPDSLYDGVFRQCGVIRADSIPELFDFCRILGTGLLPVNNRVIIQTHSGGPGAAAADACSRNGLKLPQFSEEVLTKLAPLVPHTGSVNNPVDLTFSKNPMDYFAEIPDTLLEEPAAGSLLIYFLTPSRLIRRSMEGLAIAPDQIPQLTEKLFDDQAGSLASLVEKHQNRFSASLFRAMTTCSFKSYSNTGCRFFPRRSVRRGPCRPWFAMLR